MIKYAVEFIGTFFLVLTIGFTVLEPGAGAMAPLAIGSALMVMIYAGGHISGGAFNPAVAIGITVMGLSIISNIWIFLVANLIGGAIAAVVFNSLNPDDK